MKEKKVIDLEEITLAEADEDEDEAEADKSIAACYKNVRVIDEEFLIYREIFDDEKYDKNNLQGPFPPYEEEDDISHRKSLKLTKKVFDIDSLLKKNK